jgi:hypothetical protein
MAHRGPKPLYVHYDTKRLWGHFGFFQTNPMLNSLTRDLLYVCVGFNVAPSIHSIPHILLWPLP